MDKIEKQVNWNVQDDTNKDTMPITYPNNRFSKSMAARPDDENVEKAKEWVDENEK